MDLVEIQEIIYFASGIAAALVTAYGTMKAQRKTLYPVKKIEAGREKIKTLTETNEFLGGVAELISEVSADEVSDMIAKKKELDAMPEITTEQKALTLGMMFMSAMKKDEQ
jgi:hypothetical protein